MWAPDLELKWPSWRFPWSGSTPAWPTRHCDPPASVLDPVAEIHAGDATSLFNQCGGPVFEAPGRHNLSNDTLSGKPTGERRRCRNAGSARGSGLGDLAQGTGAVMMPEPRVWSPLSARKPRAAPAP